MFGLERKQITDLLFQCLFFSPYVAQLADSLVDLGREYLFELFDVDYSGVSNGTTQCRLGEEEKDGVVQLTLTVVACCIASTKRMRSPRISFVKSAVHQRPVWGLL